MMWEEDKFVSAHAFIAFLWYFWFWMGDIEVVRWNRVDFLVPKHLRKNKIGLLEQIWAKNPYVTFLLGHPVFYNIVMHCQVMDPLTAIERHNNFRHIFQSLLVLFRWEEGQCLGAPPHHLYDKIITIKQTIIMIVRCATGEAWPDIMLAGIGGRPCDPKSYNRFLQ